MYFAYSIFVRKGHRRKIFKQWKFRDLRYGSPAETSLTHWQILSLYSPRHLWIRPSRSCRESWRLLGGKGWRPGPWHQHRSRAKAASPGECSRSEPELSGSEQHLVMVRGHVIIMWAMIGHVIVMWSSVLSYPLLYLPVAGQLLPHPSAKQSPVWYNLGTRQWQLLSRSSQQAPP